MENIGWEIRPAGWILLFGMLVLLLYFIVNRNQRPPDKNRLAFN